MRFCGVLFLVFLFIYASAYAGDNQFEPITMPSLEVPAVSSEPVAKMIPVKTPEKRKRPVPALIKVKQSDGGKCSGGSDVQIIKSCIERENSLAAAEIDRISTFMSGDNSSLFAKAREDFEEYKNSECAFEAGIDKEERETFFDECGLRLTLEWLADIRKLTDQN